MDTFAIMRAGLLLGVLSPLPVCAQSTVYTWVDSDGQVRYSDEAPANGRAREMAIEPWRPPSQPVAAPAAVAPAVIPAVEPVQAAEPVVAVVPPTPQTVSESSGTLFLWLDANGTTHYGEDPPEGVVARPVSLPPLQSEAAKPKAQVFSWRDASGRIHYGSEPPEDVFAEPVDLESRSLTTVGGGALRPTEQKELEALRPIAVPVSPGPAPQ